MKFVEGNLLDAPVQALVNTVNTVGVMGKGVALQFKKRFPQNFKHYVQACKAGELAPGKLLVVRELTMEGEKIIVNFPTKTEWFRKSQYQFIEQGLVALATTIAEQKIESIALPPLGCGNGGLQWEKVTPMIEHHLGKLPGVEVLVYEPGEEINAVLKNVEPSSTKVALTDARAMLLYALFHYEAMGENTSLFVANKLAYLLQRLGETTLDRLEFKAHHYGPYSVGVAHVLHHLNGAYLQGLEQMNAGPFEVLALRYDRWDEVSNYVNNQLNPDQQTRLKSLLQLVDGFQSSLSLEVLATVDFVRRSQPSASLEEVKQTIAQWSSRKKHLFKDRYVEIAYRHLDSYSQSLSIV